MKRTSKLGLAALLISLTATPLMAADYSTMSTADMAALRGTMQQATQEERSAFQQEWQNRMRQMGPADQQQYAGRPDSAPQDGSGQQYRKGNGSQYGQGDANSADGYGSGNGSRGGAMMGGRGGRR